MKLEKVDLAIEYVVQFPKKWFKSFINSFRIPSLVNLIFLGKKKALEKAQPSVSNWGRLGLEKNWQLFLALAILLVLRGINFVTSNIISIKNRADILAYDGPISPITLIYKATALIENITLIIQLIAFIVIATLFCNWFRRAK